jgi:hypothetical protein
VKWDQLSIAHISSFECKKISKQAIRIQFVEIFEESHYKTCSDFECSVLQLIIWYEIKQPNRERQRINNASDIMYMLYKHAFVELKWNLNQSVKSSQ